MVADRANSRWPLRRASVRRRGLTLVEVLAALLILGGAVSVMLTAQMRSLEQIAHSQWSCEAEDLARELVAEWTLAKEDFKTATQGRIGRNEIWTFDRTSRAVDVRDDLSMVEVTLTLSRRTGNENDEPWARSFVWLVPGKKNGK